MIDKKESNIEGERERSIMYERYGLGVGASKLILECWRNPPEGRGQASDDWIIQQREQPGRLFFPLSLTLLRLFLVLSYIL